MADDKVLSIREKMEEIYEGAEPETTEVQATTEEVDDNVEAEEAAESEPEVPEPTPMVPPADMNKIEREAFLNPTAENRHILQAYLNRRAYETRSDYTRKYTEAEELRKKAASIYDVMQEHQDYYQKRGIPLSDVARRSILWDKAMAQDPINTAIEWLDAYGLSLDDLSRAASTQPAANTAQQSQAGFLTAEQAEEIAQKKLEAYFAEQEKKTVDYFNQQVVSSFISSKPLFRDPETGSQLEAEMAPIVQALTNSGRYSNPQDILETAYNYVVNGNPVFSGLNQKIAATPSIEQTQAVTQRAKQAAKSITGSTGSGTPRLQVKDLRENLRRRMAGD